MFYKYPFVFKFKVVTQQDVMVKTVLFLAHKTVTKVAVISQMEHVQDA